MLYSDRFDVTKTSESSATLLVNLKKCIKFQPNVCNRCHDLLMMSMNLSILPF